MSNYTNTLKLCGLHFSHSTAFHVQINSCWQAFGIHYDLLTLNNNIRDGKQTTVAPASSSAGYEGVGELCEGGGRSTNAVTRRVYARLLNTFLVIFTVQWRKPESLIHMKTMEQSGSVEISEAFHEQLRFSTSPHELQL